MAAPLQMGSAIFLLAANLISNLDVKVSPKRPVQLSTKYITLGTRKYPWTYPRFYNLFWRNKPRHTLSLQTRSVGAPKGCFRLFPLCSERVDKKNVKSSIFRKKTSKFLSSLPFKAQTIDNQWEYDDASVLQSFIMLYFLWLLLIRWQITVM